MVWKNIRKIENTKLLEKIEKQFDVSLPLEYKNLVKAYNAGIPTLAKFIINGKNFYFERLISVNENDIPNVLTALSWVEQGKDYFLMPIALDRGDNLLSLMITAEKYSVVLVDFESGIRYFLADSLDEFLLMLNEN